MARTKMTEARVTPELVSHLEACQECGAFAARLDALRTSLRGHHAGATPDSAFASRVRSRLKVDETVEALGWAAVRLLPVSLAVALVLAWAAWERGPAIPESVASATVAEVSSDPLEWLFDGSGESP